MKRSTSSLHTSCVAPAERSKRYLSSTARRPRRHGAGLGIAIASNAEGLRAGTTAPRQKISAMLGCALGASRIQRQRPSSMLGGISNRNTASRRMRSIACVALKADAALSASGKQPGFLSTTATPKGTSDLCSARPATHSSGGTSGRRARSSSSKNTWNRTASSGQPCHADVLLEIANAPLPAARDAASREVGG